MNEVLLWAMASLSGSESCDTCIGGGGVMSRDKTLLIAWLKCTVKPV